MTADEL